MFEIVYILNKQQLYIFFFLSREQKITSPQHQEQSGGDISIDGRKAQLLLTIRNITENLDIHSQTKKELPEMINSLPFVSQPLPLCEMLPSTNVKDLALVPLIYVYPRYKF